MVDEAREPEFNSFVENDLENSISIYDQSYQSNESDQFRVSQASH